MKKEELNYYDEFIEMTDYAVNISHALYDYSNTYSYEQSKEFEQKVHEQENLADNTQHMILNYLIKDFVPPIDREDIISVSRRLDDVIDNIDEVVIDLDIFLVETLRDDFLNYVSLFAKAMFFLVLIASIVGSKPDIPTKALTNNSSLYL